MNHMTRRRFTAEFKTQAVELVNHGRAVPEVAEDLGIGASILYRWVRKASSPEQLGSHAKRAVGVEAAADELLRLRREVADLRLDNDILKKAAVILGTKPQPKREK
jgi:transposase